MTDKEVQRIQAELAEMAKRHKLPALKDEKNQAQIDNIQAQILRGDFSTMSIDDILKGL